MNKQTLSLLPPPIDLETKHVLRKLAVAHRYLAELKGVVGTIPNEAVLINTLTLQEAKDSSEIENIITTHDEIYKSSLFEGVIQDLPTKEVSQYAKALRAGFSSVKENGLITTNLIISLYQELEQSDGGLRKQAGTTLKNQMTGEIIYTPPQEHNDVIHLMTNLEKFINDDSMLDADPLVKMAVIHRQFESIHPFYDGNGLTGRIINILYLVAQELLDIPILYLSGYIIKTKQRYYELLQHVRDHGSWEEWIIYILEGIEYTSRNTISLILEIKSLMQEYKHRIRSELPKYIAKNYSIICLATLTQR